MKASFRYLAWMWILLGSDAIGQTATYTVKPGDSLSKIARVQGCTVEALAKANGIKLSAIIQAGQTLKVPGKPATGATGGSHTIQAGDTFSSISRQYGVPVETLLAANPGLNPKSLKPGDKLLLAGGPKPAATQKPETARETPAAATAGVSETSVPATAREKPDATPAATQAEPPAEATPQAAEGAVQTIMVESEMTFGEFAKQHGTNVQRLNELNGLDLTEATVLAKGSELYVPTQP